MGRYLTPARPFRLPHYFAPYKVSSYINDKNAVVVEFTFQENCEDAKQWATGIIDIARVFGDLFAQATKRVEIAERERRTEAINGQWRARQRAVQRAYCEYRSSGLKHRMAIRSLLNDPRVEDLRLRYRWDSAEFSTIVRMNLGPSSLSVVPKTPTVRR